jgi:hypothetical protein
MFRDARPNFFRAFGISAAFGTIAFLIAVSLGGLVFNGNPEYLRDLQNNDNPDARGYSLLAKNLSLHGKFSKAESLQPDPNRTPGYPLFIVMINGISNPTRLYLVQCCLFWLSVALLVRLARNLFGLLPGCVAGAFLLVAIAQ